MIYIAGPYTHKVPYVRQIRYEAHRLGNVHVCKTELECAKEAHFYPPVFSPIVAGHNMLPELDHWDQEMWMRYCIPFVERSDKVVILQLPGWDKSKGVDQEAKIAAYRKIPVEMIPMQVFMTPREIDGHMWAIQQHGL